MLDGHGCYDSDALDFGHQLNLFCLLSNNVMLCSALPKQTHRHHETSWSMQILSITFFTETENYHCYLQLPSAPLSVLASLSTLLLYCPQLYWFASLSSTSFPATGLSYFQQTPAVINSLHATYPPPIRQQTTIASSFHTSRYFLQELNQSRAKRRVTIGLTFLGWPETWLIAVSH